MQSKLLSSLFFLSSSLAHVYKIWNMYIIYNKYNNKLFITQLLNKLADNYYNTCYDTVENITNAF